jgi:hypothetical protein
MVVTTTPLFARATVDIGILIRADVSKSWFMDIGSVDNEEIWISFDPPSIIVLEKIQNDKI